MFDEKHQTASTVRTNRRTLVQLLLSATLLLTLGYVPVMQAQTYTVLYNFTGGSDGAIPWAGVTMDRNGNLFGTTSGGGVGNNGAVYELTHKNSRWVFSPVYVFEGGSDGASPLARVVFHGSTLYGTTNSGGGSAVCSRGGYPPGCGTVFSLVPPVSPPKSPQENHWNETVLYRFQGGTDGAYLGYGDLIFDQAGAMYNTASQGGLPGGCYGIGCGTVYKLTHSGGSWNLSLLYTFPGAPDASLPVGPVYIDPSGKIYATTYFGGTSNQGSIFELTPSGSGYTETVLHNFQGSPDGYQPYAGFISDANGNLYGSTTGSGPSGGGTVFELTSPGGSSTYNVLYSFNGATLWGPARNLVMDAAGNLYGTTAVAGSHSNGAVFKLTYSGGTWNYTSLHDFTGGTDGGAPLCNLIFDASGNIYGTASSGGANGKGVVFEITP